MLALGFRPFFLLAAILASSFVPLWMFGLFGGASTAAFASSSWHAHEMLFGFTTAVIAGFLLTAVRNWTARPTPTGASLGGLVALWALGRVAFLSMHVLPALLVACVDLAFVPVLALSIAIPIVRAGNWRNLAFVPLVLLLFGANLVFHFGGSAWTSRASNLAVDVVVLFIVVMGGRVIPSFTSNVVGGSARKFALVEWGSVVAVLMMMTIELTPWPRVFGATAVFAGVLNGARMVGWQSLATRKHPILWVLHLGYLWIAIGLVLEGVAAFEPTWIRAAPTHALTVGAIGMLTLGMIARVSLGHTGRLIVATRPIAFAFAFLMAAALVRSIGPLALPSAYSAEIVLSGLLWSIAFAVFVVAYWTILTTPRIDGKPG